MLGALAGSNLAQNAGVKNAAAQKATDGTDGSAAKSQLTFEDPRKNLQLKGDVRASGVMTDILGAGPNQQPWNGNWVFGGDAAELQAKAMNLHAPGTLGKLSSAGSDENLLRAKAGDLESQVAALEQMMKMAGGAGAAEAVLVGSNEGMGGNPRLQSKVGPADELADGEGLDGMEVDVGPGSAPALAGARAIPHLSGEEFLRALGNGAGREAGAKSGGSFRGANAMKNGAGADDAANSATRLRAIPGGIAGAKGMDDELGGAMGNAKGDLRGPAREIGSGVGKLETQPRFESLSLTANHGANPTNLGLGAGATVPVMTGNVIPGSMMRERLASESVVNFSNQIASLGPKGGGEMKIRMNPENLGELLINVSTRGKDVSLKVQATRGEAKKILEESAASLKDALGTQNLTLAKLEFTVVPESAASAANSGMNTDVRSDQQNTSSSSGREYANNSNDGRSAGDRGSNSNRAFNSAAAAFAGTPRASAVQSGRLDVTA